VTLFIEVVSIIVAVCLGFLVNEWRESMHNSSRADAALSGITAEISLNRDHLAERIPYYQRMLAALDSLAASHGTAPFAGRSIEGWHGLNPPLLRGAAYEAASATGALSLVDFEVADQIAQAYLGQEMVKNTFDWTLQSILAGQLETWEDAQRVFSLALEASQLGLQTYDSVLARLQSRSDAAEQE